VKLTMVLPVPDIGKDEEQIDFVLRVVTAIEKDRVKFPDIEVRWTRE